MCALILYVPVKNQLCRDGPSYVDPVLSKDQCVLLEDTMQAWTRNSSVSSKALYHRATAPPLLSEENAMKFYYPRYTGLLVISFAASFFCFFFTANYVDPASSGSSFEPWHKIAAIIVACMQRAFSLTLQMMFGQ